MTLESSKILGGIGALMIFIATPLGFAIPYAGLLGLIGLILMLIGLKGLADFYREGGIFNNTLYAIILAIVGIVIAVATIIVTALSALASIGINLSNVSDWAMFGSELANYFTNFGDFSAIWTLLGAVISALVIIYVFIIVTMIFLRRSMNQLSSKTGVGLFGTAGLLMLIGAVLPLIGLLLIWIGFILLAVAFFQIKEQSTRTASTAL